MAFAELKIDTSELDGLTVELSEEKLEGWLKRVVLEAQNILTREMRKGGRGRVYRRRGKVHRASAPGDYPAVDTGRLARSTTVAVNYPAAWIGSGVSYAPYLMFGTSKMARRKLYGDALEEAIPKVPLPSDFVSFRVRRG